MLKVNHLYKSYRSGANVYEVLKDVNFEVKKGEFVALALVSENDEPISPCGACRQVMMELMPRDALAGRKRQKTATVADLLPMAFDEEDIR